MDPIIAAKMSDDFKGVVVDLLCSEQVGIVGTNCL